MAIIVKQTAEGVERFQGEPHLSAAKIAALVDEGVWTDKDLAEHGLMRAQPAEIQEGEAANSPERFEVINGEVRQVFDVVKVPETVSKAVFLAAMDDEEAEQFLDGMTAKERALWLLTPWERVEEKEEKPVIDEIGEEKLP